MCRFKITGGKASLLYVGGCKDQYRIDMGLLDLKIRTITRWQASGTHYYLKTSSFSEETKSSTDFKFKMLL